jgi:RNA polymerase-binding protein DksA
MKRALSADHYSLPPSVLGTPSETAGTGSIEEGMHMAPAAGSKATGTKAAPAKKSVKAAPTKAAPAQAATKAKVVAKAAPAKKAAPAAKKAAPAKPAAKAAPAKPAKKVAEKKAAPVKKVPRKKTVICSLSGFEVMPSAPGLSPKTKERLKEKLLEEKARLQHQAEELVAEAEELAREREGGDTQFDEESGEGDTVNIERERDLLLSAQARHVVDEIDAALARMKKGTYGVCSYAGRKIPVERLEAIPWADVCVDCKARAERRR